MIRRWFIDPSDATLNAQGDLLCWSLVAGMVWATWSMWWPLWLGARIVGMIFGG